MPRLSAPMGARGKGRMVLVVDDAVSLRNMVRDACASEGDVVIGADSIASARRTTARRTFDAAVIDVMLPDGSGLDLIPALLQRNPSMVVVVATAYAFPAAAAYAMQLGAADYLEKPFPLGELRRAIDGLPRARETLHGEPVSLEYAEWAYISEVLHDTGGNITQAARRLGIHRQSLQRKLRYGRPRKHKVIRT